MPISVNVQNNPNRATVGTEAADAVVINSNVAALSNSRGIVYYEIRRRDRQPIIQSNETATVNSSPANRSVWAWSSADGTAPQDVLAISYRQLQVILPLGTHYQVRVKRNDLDNLWNGSWSAWTNFKTRDKKYRTADAITQLTDTTQTSMNKPASDGPVTITVTNTAKASEVRTSRGSTVTNSDNGYNSTTSVTATSRGATVVNSD